jgi:hypothetical protein
MYQSRLSTLHEADGAGEEEVEGDEMRGLEVDL